MAEKPDITVSVDFGTTYTGVAWMTQKTPIQVINDWPGSGDRGERKVPTTLIYNEDGELSSWGFMCDDDDDSVPGKTRRDFFKIYIDEETLVEAQGRGLSNVPQTTVEAQKFATDYLHQIYLHVKDTIETQMGRKHLGGWAGMVVTFLFSVPTTWTRLEIINTFKAIIRDAGFGGGGSKHVAQVDLTEAEAAAVATLKMSAISFNKGSLFLTVDAGGGTTDLALMRVTSSDASCPQMAQISTVKGVGIGSTLVDRAFIRVVTERLVANPDIQRQLPSDFASRFSKSHHFKVLKHKFGEKVYMQPVFKLQMEGVSHGFSHAGLGVEYGRMQFKMEEIQSLFDAQVDGIMQRITDQLDWLSENGYTEQVEYMILSGGLGSSAYVRDKISLHLASRPHASAARVAVTTIDLYIDSVMNCCCFIVPPHLFRAIAQSPHNPESVRRAAEVSLAAHDRIATARQERTLKVIQDKRGKTYAAIQASPFVPGVLLEQLSASDAVDEATRSRAKRDLRHIQDLMSKAHQVGTDESATREATKVGACIVYNASNTWDNEKLPGKLERGHGEPPTKDSDVNKAYENVGHVLRFYEQLFDWTSVDNQNAPVTSTVHFGDHYENAFWSPEAMQMVFGDGNTYLHNFTACVDIIGHELTHAVTDNTSPLEYNGQSGALNEHVSDVFGIMVKQQVQKVTAEEADWLIGENCLLPNIKGVALRSMKEPGKAYDDERFGRDPQVDNFTQWEVVTEDRGGVHIFSGIPNKAFYLSAVAFGGYSWEIAGKIWWRAMNCGKVPIRCTFQQFADVTVECAEELFDVNAAKTVRTAWIKVGVTRGI